MVVEITGGKVGEVAAQTGLSIRTLRHYDELGMVTPSGHTPGGFRLYAPADVHRLLLIDRMKPLGFTLEEIREFLAVADAVSAPAVGQDRGQAEKALASFRAQAYKRLEVLRDRVARSEELLTQLDALDTAES